MTPGADTNDWPEHRRLVIAELDRHDRQLKALEDALATTRHSISILQVKSVTYGFLAGAVASGVALFFGIRIQ